MSSGVQTVSTRNLHTWWQEGGVKDSKRIRIYENKVRQSHAYRVQVRSAPPAGAADAPWYDSFVYESIPRGGNGFFKTPVDSPNPQRFTWDECSDGDGISELEHKANLSMAWSQFEYDDDVEVKITPCNGVKLNEVTIRPTALHLEAKALSDAVVIRVPRNPDGFKFSVEFRDDIIEYFSDGTQYVKDGRHLVGREPRNALLIFASPFPAAEVTPPMSESNTTVMKPGPIYEGDWGSKAILYFPPGVYWMNSTQDGQSPRLGQNHIRLHENTYWVHFDPGAYVKGAIEYTTKNKHLYATGHGVLSGEHYVYTANPKEGYHGKKHDWESLRMWWHKLPVPGQTWHCAGPTITAPPFNSMDMKDPNDQIHVSARIQDYKQVGAWYYQTDGLQLNPDSTMRDVFYHCNDDAIKAYHGHVDVDRVTVWKIHNDPVIQMGWDLREVSHFSLRNLWVIHTRYFKHNDYVPAAIIGASPFYVNKDDPPEKKKKRDFKKQLAASITNVVCEGPCPGLLKISPLQSYDLKISNVEFQQELNPVSEVAESYVKGVDDFGSGKMAIEINNWSINGEKVTMDTFRSNQLGKLNIDKQYWKQWKINEVLQPV
ncbi:glycoside hydrolase family 49 protein [Trichoderma virens Gv29-8]|uniref:Glycoside hydrolase family 49 protein n=1 Tax=Hypocrea virens (strain Gv29-8 / FGSC 10586) TaxID=413071 RepID=G9MDL9_HYPVG|nr:glycoside hydrolase family 49 protein [Trichoderma virens Gv29-8]EHK27178.1 glycoside hydrolase family 49 protein [Trichoderma virens Gv29-8]